MAHFTANGEWIITQADGSPRALTEDEKIVVVTLARELHDRFVMGGWEPSDAYGEISQIVFGTWPIL